MKIIQARTGSAAVLLPSLGVIVVDPDTDHDAAVGAVRAALPTVNRDQAERWVRTALPPKVVSAVTN